MKSTFLIYMIVISLCVTAFCLALTSLARNRAREEIHKRKIVEHDWKRCKSLYLTKERALQYRLEAKEKEIIALKSEMKVLELQYEKNNQLSNTESVTMKYLIDSKDNKIEAQLAKITMLQADCNRLQKELRMSKNNVTNITDCSTNKK